jgi:hypothetical protein
MGLAEDVVELFQTTRHEALLAEKNGDVDEALRLYRVCQGYIATTPDHERDGQTMTWRSDLQAKIDDLVKLTSGRRGIQQQKIEYARPGVD